MTENKIKIEGLKNSDVSLLVNIIEDIKKSYVSDNTVPKQYHYGIRGASEFNLQYNAFKNRLELRFGLILVLVDNEPKSKPKIARASRVYPIENSIIDKFKLFCINPIDIQADYGISDVNELNLEDIAIDENIISYINEYLTLVSKLILSESFIDTTKKNISGRYLPNKYAMDKFILERNKSVKKKRPYTKQESMDIFNELQKHYENVLKSLEGQELNTTKSKNIVENYFKERDIYRLNNDNIAFLTRQQWNNLGLESSVIFPNDKFNYVSELFKFIKKEQGKTVTIENIYEYSKNYWK